MELSVVIYSEISYICPYGHINLGIINLKFCSCL